MSTPTNTTQPPEGQPRPGELPKSYKPSEHERIVWDRWVASKAFHADPSRVLSGEREPYCVLIPPPNVTARLHLGHALNNTLQDILVRAHRMRGYEAMWMPGTDHAGIATQAVVEKRVLQEEGKRRHQFSREEFVRKIQAFKDEYEAQITGQLQRMGCSCDFDRQRFTMDDQCAAAVREAFFRLFRDGLIYRGKRLVNWDCVLQTAVADDECYDEEVDGNFYYLRYPLVTPRSPRVGNEPRHAERGSAPITWDELASRDYPGADDHPADQQAWITVATTRPETYLGDTAVAINPHDPRAKSLHGLHVELPLVGRIIPIIEDSYVVLPERYARTDEEKSDPKAKMATGFLKVTPAHDPNDYEIGQRHKLPMINVLAPDGTISDKHGFGDVGSAHVFVGRPREHARKMVVKEFDARGLFEGSKPTRHSIKHSDRSDSVVEPYLSDQWYVKVTDPRMAKAANEVLASAASVSFTDGTDAKPVSVHSRGAGVPPATSPPITHQTHPTHDSTSPLAAVGSRLEMRLDRLPHWQQGGCTLFVTFRTQSGVLTEAERALVLDACRHWHGQKMELHAAVVMPDHVHLMFSPFDEVPGRWHSMSELLHSIKSYSAHAISKLRGAPGVLWQNESFDRIVRDDEWENTVAYIQTNPVRQGLATNWTEYPHTWVSPHTRAGKFEFADRVRGCHVGQAPREPAANMGARGTSGGRRDACPTSEIEPSSGTQGACATQTTRQGQCTGAAQSLQFFPARYAKTYEQWHDNIRDWCISRQLWWGHRIPVWSHPTREHTLATLTQVQDLEKQGRLCTRMRSASLSDVLGQHTPDTLHSVAVRDEQDREAIELLERAGFVRDPDVLDTWFSSALWPLSTLGWPDPSKAWSDNPRSADLNKGLLDAFNPTNTLCTAREIITLWVSRMVMFNRYFRRDSACEIRHAQSTAGSSTNADALGPPPFRDVFIHCVIQDGQGQKMSKSLGNGVDPLDIIETHGADAMRFTLCHMATQTQDVRLPVDLICPHTGATFTPKMVKVSGGYTVQAPIQTSPKDPTKKMVTVYGVVSGEAKATADMPLAKNTSAKFDFGRNFATKLWNASRLTMMSLDASGGVTSAHAGGTHAPTTTPVSATTLLDRWMLSRLAFGAQQADDALAAYQFSEYAQALYDLLWRDFCDWYLEGIKPTIASSAPQRAVLGATLDSVLRLLHPVMPFVTETIWSALSPAMESVPSVAGVGLDARPPGAPRVGTNPQPLLCTAPWPNVDASLRDAKVEEQFDALRALVAAIRDVRASQQVKPSRKVTLHAQRAGRGDLPSVNLANEEVSLLVRTFAGLDTITLSDAPPSKDAPNSVAFTHASLTFVVSNLRDAAATGAASGDGSAAGIASAGGASDAEKTRLTKQGADLEKSIATLEARLANPGYADRAPPAMVQQTRDQLAKAKAELAACRETLRAMG